jgi:hypothetical protein
MPLQRLEHTFNDYNYFTEFDLETGEFDFRIDYPTPKETPEFLIKYYCLNHNNINAVTSNYLFSSHPDQLNDKYDCSGDLIDFSGLQKEFIMQKLVVEVKKYAVQEFNEIWDSEYRWILLKNIAEFERTRLFMKFGIISFSTKENDILLWSYYSQNSGFAIKLKTELLPQGFIGPFYINYSPDLAKIEYTNTNPPLCIHYQTNIKQDIWQHENEWRFITFNPEGHYHPDFGKKDIDSRKSYYNKDSISEIILGYNFFTFQEINRQSEFDLITLRPSKGIGLNAKKLRRKLLSYIVENHISCSRMIRKTQEYDLFNEPVTIEQISCNKFKIISNLQE